MLKLATSAIGMCVVAASISVFCAGCSQKNVHAAAPVTVPPVPPSPIPTQGKSKSPASIPPPTTPAPANPASTTTSPPLNSTPDSPKKPATTPPASEPERPAAPQISPQISASDQSQLQQQANQYVATASENLHRADGRDLNATQKDMADKIRGFLNQAQQAIQTSDWVRAKNLSQKAYLLSLDLIKTF